MKSAVEIGDYNHEGLKYRTQHNRCFTGDTQACMMETSVAFNSGSSFNSKGGGGDDRMATLALYTMDNNLTLLIKLWSNRQSLSKHRNFCKD